MGRQPASVACANLSYCFCFLDAYAAPFIIFLIVLTAESSLRLRFSREPGAERSSIDT